MLIKEENPEIYNFDVQGTSVMCDGSSLLQGEDIQTTVAYFIAWDVSTMELYLSLLEEEYGEHLRVEDMVGLSTRRS